MHACVMRRDEIEYIRVLVAIEAAVAAEELDGKPSVAAHTTHTCLPILHSFYSFNRSNQVYTNSTEFVQRERGKRGRERERERDLRDKYLYGVLGQLMKEALQSRCVYICMKGIDN